MVIYLSIGVLKEHMLTLNTRTTYTPKQSYRLWWGAADQCTWSRGTYIHIYPYYDTENPVLYNWNVESIKTSMENVRTGVLEKIKNII